MTTEAETQDWSEKIGEPAYASILEMVRALDLDTYAEDWTKEQPMDKLRRHWAEEKQEENGELPEDDDEAREQIAQHLADGGTLGDFAFYEDGAREAIEQDALSLRFRSGWSDSATDLGEAEEFELLLTTGGPAVRIMGEVSGGEPSRAWLEVQDWFKPWTQYIPADQDILLAYARCFYMGG